MFFDKMQRVHGNIGAKMNSKTLLWNTFLKILSGCLRIGLQSLKKVLIWPKNSIFRKFEFGYQNNAEFHADFETVEKNAKNSLRKKL